MQLLYSRESIMFSEQAYQAILGAEEILLRNHVPYGLLPTNAAKELVIPDDCELLLVCDQKCLSDSQVDALLEFAWRGGRLALRGQSGEYDQWYGQRRSCPLRTLDSRPNVIRRDEVAPVPVKSGGWTIKVVAPKDGGRGLLADIAALYPLAIRITAPPTVFAEIKRDARSVSVHLLNYAPEPVDKGIRIAFGQGLPCAEGCTFAAPMEQREPVALNAQADGQGGWVLDVPGMTDHAVVEIPRLTP